MFKIVLNLLLSFVVLFVSCGDEEAEEVLGPDGSPIDPNKGTLYLSMEDAENYIVSINATNFTSVSTISFLIGYDPAVFSVKGISTELSLSNEIGPLYTEGTVGIWYELSAQISGDQKKIVTINFEPKGGDPKGTDISFYELIFLDSSDNYLYYNCSSPSSKTPQVCEDNGGNWEVSDELKILPLCYIDQGIITQATINTSEPMTDWTPTGDYVWSNSWCQYE